MNSTALFDKMAASYDAVWTTTAVGRAQRDLVWREMDRDDPVCVIDTVHLLGDAHDRLDDQVIGGLANEQTLGLPRDQSRRSGKHKSD